VPTCASKLPTTQVGEQHDWLDVSRYSYHSQPPRPTRGDGARGIFMIGLSFLAAGLAWLALSWYLATRLPVWLGIVKPAWQWPISALLLAAFLIGPFLDHIVGMRQFDKLCKEQTGLQISPKAENVKRGIQLSSAPQLLKGYAIPIKQRTDSIVDLGTSEVVAQYKHFSTVGGRVGGMVRLGGAYECAIFQSNHPDFSKYLGLKNQIEFTTGETK
jgi:hypothetical protein